MSASAALSIRFLAESGEVKLVGSATIDTAGKLAETLAAIPAASELSFDLAEIERIDTAGAQMIVAAERRILAAGGDVRISMASTQATSLLERVRRAQVRGKDNSTHKISALDRLENLGRISVNGAEVIAEWFGIFGLFLSRLGRCVLEPRQFRLTSLVHHIQEVGVKAVPIVALMAFLIGVVLAFQGSAQLRQFGAEVFVVDLIAISILRELGILLTAIIVAGRTASAFTAAIGSMKMREEIDAMQTLAIDPGQALIVPRILALLISLPILGLIADFAGLFGGALMSWIELNISPAMFRTRLFEGTDIRHVWVGLVKAPVFAVIIGVIGCWAGLKVERDAESLGRMTSSAVVAAIFVVIVADAAFSIFFAQIGI